MSTASTFNAPLPAKPSGDEPEPPRQRRDTVSVLGSSLFQPIADHIDKLLGHEELARPTHSESGYAAVLIVQLNMLLESYVARLRYTRKSEVRGNLTVTSQLREFFADLPDVAELEEVYVIGKAIGHNHIWNLVEANDMGAEEVLLTPKDLGMATKQEWARIVDVATRRSRLLALSAVPTEADRHDVRAVLNVVWSTLRFMASKSYADTPVHRYATVRFRGKHVNFGDLVKHFPASRPVPGPFVVQLDDAA